VVFGNGVFNSRDDAGKSRDYLEDSLGRRANFSPFVDLAYANDGGAALTFTLAVGALPAMGQLLELFLQSGVVDTTNYWKWVSDALAAPQWFRDGMKQIAAGVNGANYVLDGDVQRHVTIYEASLKAGNKVVIVSHSQGNFYSNAAYRVLTQRGYGNNVGIVAVATPSRIVEGGGTYITAPEDKIIKAVRATLNN
ncbi:MAG: hypothetical protein L3J61_03215, partial [Ghiorsea sp.]|nr:hypothetical protein [Ghiorsea sp.]